MGETTTCTSGVFIYIPPPPQKTPPHSASCMNASTLFAPVDGRKNTTSASCNGRNHHVRKWSIQSIRYIQSYTSTTPQLQPPLQHTFITTTTNKPPPHSASCLSASTVSAPVGRGKTPPAQVATGETTMCASGVFVPTAQGETPPHTHTHTQTCMKWQLFSTRRSDFTDCT